LAPFLSRRLKRTKKGEMNEFRRQKKERSYNITNNKHLQPIADNIYREFWHSLPVPPFDRLRKG
jgi:hypothetical protein